MTPGQSDRAERGALNRLVDSAKAAKHYAEMQPEERADALVCLVDVEKAVRDLRALWRWKA